MVLRVLRKINKIHLCSDTKTRWIVVFLTQFATDCVCFLNFYVLDCVHNRIYSVFASLKGQFRVRSLDFSQLAALYKPWFEKIMSFQQVTKPKSNELQMQQPCNSRKQPLRRL
jgi:hypothetical protein